MSVFASIGVYNRESDWIIALAGLIFVFLIFYPSYILFVRYRHMRRIKHQLVTSMYNLPIKFTPVELAYIFSTKVKSSQLYATLLDLANRSVLVLHNDHGRVTATIGPKVDKNLHSFEKLLIDQIISKSEPANIDKILEGITSYEVKSGVKVSGSKNYVFWWLLRDTLRTRNIIQKKLSKRYAMMLFYFGVVGSLVVSVLSVLFMRFVQMINDGEVDFDRLGQSIYAAIGFWVISIIPMLFVSFVLLKYRGRMLGRDWIMTATYRRYLGQMDAFREFVRLTHKGTLKFESKELYEESLAHTRPYAIACGYIKK
jgi:hypothetical protein